MIKINGINLGYNNTNKYTYRILKDVIIKIVRGFIFRALGVKSKGILLIGKGVKISGKYSYLKTGKNCKIENNSIIQTISNNGIVFGDNVTIGQGTLIRPSGLYNGEIGDGLSIGSYSSIGVESYIGCSGQIIIGNYVMIGPKITIIAENHKHDRKDIPMLLQGVIRKGVTIEDDVWIGANVTILDGIKIGKGSIIGAGSIVTKDIPQYVIAVGCPARVIKSR